MRAQVRARQQAGTAPASFHGARVSLSDVMAQYVRAQKEVLEKEVANADRNLRIEKQMAKLAEERERTNLEKREWESHEASVKDDYKATPHLTSPSES